MDIETLIIGAGAAGLFCAGRSGPGTLLLDHAKAPGEKIRISGGGRCNFTNLRTGPEHFISGNRHFAKSALARFSPHDFVGLVDAAGIDWHEKALGQLFCDGSAKQIVAMLLAAVEANGAQVWLGTSVEEVAHKDGKYRVWIKRQGVRQEIIARNLVIATGGKSIPKMGATGFGYQIAEQFGHKIVQTRPGLVPLTFGQDKFTELAGVSLPVRATAGGKSFDEALLFTHRGLSGPAILQISNFWQEGAEITLDLLPGQRGADLLRAAAGAKTLGGALSGPLPSRLASYMAKLAGYEGKLGQLNAAKFDALGDGLNAFTLLPTGSEGYRTAEVTLGGIDTNGLSSKTMQSKSQPGLYFIGECLDVTGWLGGYNFQWAWASAVAAAQNLRDGP